MHRKCSDGCYELGLDSRGPCAVVDKVLIFRLGSLGDTMVALPCLHLIARTYPSAERRILTNFPVSAKAAPLELILGESGLVQGYFRYPVRLRHPAALFALRNQIAHWSPEVLVYLAEPRGRLATLRDIAFFRTCGIRHIVGAPIRDNLSNHRFVAERSRWEHEAERLARCLAELGDARLDDPQSWNLRFTEAERAQAQRMLAGWPGSEKRFFAAFSIGTKFDTNDWGDANWRAVLEALGAKFRQLGLVLVGAAEERERSERCAAHWPGPTLNLCGRISPRVSALALGQAVAYLGHDSGPMHLAAAVGTSCVAVFSARNKPGVWFPYGRGHRVLYHQTPCFDCGLEICVRYNKKCIASIEPQEVLSACVETLEGALGVRETG